jgi:hypothetical protein
LMTGYVIIEFSRNKKWPDRSGHFCNLDARYGNSLPSRLASRLPLREGAMLLRDGWWFLVNRRAWDIQEIVSKNINAAAMTQREDVAKQINSLKSDLTAKGLIFNDLDPATFSRGIAQVRVLRGMEN